MIRQPEVISVRLTQIELLALDTICRKNNLNRHEYIHAIVMDALVEDGYDALRCWESERREGSREAIETCGATTP